MTRPPWPLRNITNEVSRLADAESRRNAAVRAAFDPQTRRDLGYTIDDIAAAAGLSRARIYQIVQEAEDAEA